MYLSVYLLTDRIMIWIGTEKEIPVIVKHLLGLILATRQQPGPTVFGPRKTGLFKWHIRSKKTV